MDFAVEKFNFSQSKIREGFLRLVFKIIIEIIKFIDKFACLPMICAHKTFVICLAFLLLGSRANAEVIADTPSSAQYLAIQISLSSGYPAENYASYSRGLAKTLSLLTAAEQAEVFGNGGTAAPSGDSGTNSGSPNSGSGSPNSGSGNNWWNGILEYFANLFKDL